MGCSLSAALKRLIGECKEVGGRIRSRLPERPGLTLGFLVTLGFSPKSISQVLLRYLMLVPNALELF